MVFIIAQPPIIKIEYILFTHYARNIIYIKILFKQIVLAKMVLMKYFKNNFKTN